MNPLAWRKKTLIAALAGLVAALPAFAGAPGTGKLLESMPAYRLRAHADDTDPIVKLPSLKPWIVHLKVDAASIAVEDNSAGLRAVQHGDKSVVLFPRRTGSAHVVIRDASGRVLMSRSVVVAGLGQKYIRVEIGGRQRILYCPYVCYEANLAGLD